jgi:hypothetical protein
LHVLSLPPAFVLSQDQTLKLNEISIPTGHFNKTSMPPSLSTRNLKDSAVFLTSSKHIRLMLIHPRPPHGVPKRHTPDAMNFLKRDRQLSLSSRPYRQTRNQLTPTPNLTTKPQTQGLRRPRLSSFRCNCQTATRQALDLAASNTRSRSPSSLRGASAPLSASRSQIYRLKKRAKPLAPPLSRWEVRSFASDWARWQTCRETRQRNR